MSKAVGQPGLVNHDPYDEIPPPKGESYNDPSCIGAVYNTMYTAYEGIDYTGVAGTKVGEPGTSGEPPTPTRAWCRSATRTRRAATSRAP